MTELEMQQKSERRAAWQATWNEAVELLMGTESERNIDSFNGTFIGAVTEMLLEKQNIPTAGGLLSADEGISLICEFYEYWKTEFSCRHRLTIPEKFAFQAFRAGGDIASLEEMLFDGLLLYFGMFLAVKRSGKELGIAKSL